MTKLLSVAAAALALFLSAVSAQAQGAPNARALVVTSCGTNAFNVSGYAPFTELPTGLLCVSSSGGGGGGGTVTQGTSPWVDNISQWGGTTVGAPTPYGTAPTGNAPGVNAFVTAAPATTTNGSSTITTANTFQTALASSATRKGCTLVNPITATENLLVYFGSGTATSTNSIPLIPGQSASCAVSGSYVATDAIQVTAATAGHAYVLNSQ